MKPKSPSTNSKQIDPGQSPIVRLFQELGPDALDILTERQRLTVKYLWPIWARPNQLLPKGDWRVAMWCCGRGFGKTRTGAEAVRSVVESGESGDLILAGPTAADVRDIMVEGESGLLAISPAWNFPKYEPSKRRVTWTNGARAVLVSADEPDRFRGLQASFAWTDEICSWRYQESWDQLMFGLRLGNNPRAIVTTTPRPSKLMKGLLSREGEDVVVIRGSSFDNRANLPEAFFNSILERYKGTRLAKQEIWAQLLEDVDGARVSHELLDEARVVSGEVPDLQRVVVGIDPAVTSSEDSDETGIVVAGLGIDDEVYVLDDRSCRVSPKAWATRAIESLHKWAPDLNGRILGEVNNGGDLVEATIRTVDKNVPFRAVRASKGKHIRFEPVGSLFEQKRIHMVGSYPKLEDQIVMFTPSGYEGSDSPDRADALVWAVTELVLEKNCTPSVWSI